MKIEENKYCAINDPADLNKIRSFIEIKAKNFGFSEDDVNKIILAVDEACTNLIRHSFKQDKNKEFCVYVETDFNKFIINIQDNGTTFNPLEVPIKNMKEHLQTFQRGGLGVFIMRTVMDDIIYSPSNDKQPLNNLKLVKHLN